MAKYSRFDPRNKKNTRNKQRSLNRDLRIKEEKKSRSGKQLLDLEDFHSDYYEEDEIQ